MSAKIARATLHPPLSSELYVPTCNLNADRTCRISLTRVSQCHTSSSTLRSSVASDASLQEPRISRVSMPPYECPLLRMPAAHERAQRRSADRAGMVDSAAIRPSTIEQDSTRTGQLDGPDLGGPSGISGRERDPARSTCTIGAASQRLQYRGCSIEAAVQRLQY